MKLITEPFGVPSTMYSSVSTIYPWCISRNSGHPWSSSSGILAFSLVRFTPKTPYPRIPLRQILGKGIERRNLSGVHYCSRLSHAVSIKAQIHGLTNGHWKTDRIYVRRSTVPPLYMWRRVRFAEMLVAWRPAGCHAKDKVLFTVPEHTP